ncbi:MAG: hypothetical protein K8W52_26075 [Deltaproteobacteria bacterium]|nr:hypothetical protein [Deltaproteobacteria bacterium]
MGHPSRALIALLSALSLTACAGRVAWRERAPGRGTIWASLDGSDAYREKSLARAHQEIAAWCGPAAAPSITWEGVRTVDTGQAWQQTTSTDGRTRTTSGEHYATGASHWEIQFVCAPAATDATGVNMAASAEPGPVVDPPCCKR